MKGILFKPESIQAIIEGRKTQTRRLGGLKEINQEPDIWECQMLPIGVLARQKRIIYGGGKSYYVQYPNIKPRYQVGETVYIKEAYYTQKVAIKEARKAGWKIGKKVTCPACQKKEKPK